MHTFVTTFKDQTQTFSHEEHKKASQMAWRHLDTFSSQVWKEDDLDPPATVTYNGETHQVQWELAGNLCEIYPAVFSGKLEGW